MPRLTNLTFKDAIYSGSVSKAEYVGTFEALRIKMAKILYVDEKFHVNPVKGHNQLNKRLRLQGH